MRKKTKRRQDQENEAKIFFAAQMSAVPRVHHLSIGKRDDKSLRFKEEAMKHNGRKHRRNSETSNAKELFCSHERVGKLVPRELILFEDFAPDPSSDQYCIKLCKQCPESQARINLLSLFMKEVEHEKREELSGTNERV